MEQSRQIRPLLIAAYAQRIHEVKPMKDDLVRTDVAFWMCVLLATAAFFAGRACNDSGTGSSAGVAPPSPQTPSGGQPTTTSSLSDPSDPGSGASARFSTTPRPSASQTSPDASGDDFAGLDRSSLLGLDVGVQPSAEGLFARTVDLWAQPEFLTLSAAEARELLPLDDELASAPGSLLDLTGPLPTEEECARAFEDSRVRALLKQTCAAEVQLYALEAARNSAYDLAIDAQRRTYEADERDLMMQLDRASGFKGWSLMHRAYARWSDD